MIRFFFRALILFAFAAAPALSQSTEYARLLVPLYMPDPVPGAFGSQWVTDFWILNNSGQSVSIEGYYSPCPIPEGCFGRTTASGITFRPAISVGVDGTQGTFLLVDKRFIDDVRFELRAQDLSRQSQTWGTELPVVRETQFRNGKLDLLDIPTGSSFRQTLRIYDAASDRPGAVIVRLYGIRSGLRFLAPGTTPDALLGERTYEFRIPRPDKALQFYPGYVEINDLNEIASTAAADRIRIEIEPLSPTSRFWSFVSITNNETQHVTVITPK